MAFNDPFATAQSQARGRAIEMDAGLRSYMLKIYNYMASGLALTGITAFLIVNTPALFQLFFTVNEAGKMGLSGLAVLALIAVFAFPFVIQFGMNRFSSTALQGMFWAYSALMGLNISVLLMAYTGESVARAFFITAAVFGGMSLYGYTTKRDLSGMGSFLAMGLLGAIAIFFVNLFIGSSQLGMLVSGLILLCSIGLTAYENQALKSIYYQFAGYPDMLKKVAIMGALHLYISFINIFITLLQLFGQRR